MKKYALVFSGQRSERVGMFNDMLKEPTALSQILDTLKEKIGIDMHGAITTKDAAVVAKNNQLLLSIYHHLASKLVIEKIGYTPAFCMGHSFGQFSAITSSGAVDFVTMTGLINVRTNIINFDKIDTRASLKSIHGMTLDAFKHFQVDEKLIEEVELALHNQKEQLVCAATKNAEKKLSNLATKYNYVLKDVHVSRPYHTAFMEEYNQMLLPYIENMEFSVPAFPIVLNHSQQAVTDAQSLKDEVKIQMVKPVYWYDCIMGVADKVDAFVIIDPSETQSKILRRITNKRIHNVNNLSVVKMIEKKGV